MDVLTEPEPLRGVALPVLEGVARVVAPNPGPMTYHGTNTWLIDHGADGITLIDPGPEHPAHLAALLAVCAGRLARILITHGHPDHVGGTGALAAATGAASFGFAPPPGAAVIPDHLLDDGATIAGLIALHTPGHAADHLCFERADGTVFTGDHVMGWSTSVVSPPQGDMRAYISSLERLLGRSHVCYLSGHGPVVLTPEPYVRALLRHRFGRERALLAAVQRAAADIPTLTAQLYPGVEAPLRGAAERNVLAHLLKLQQDGVVTERNSVWHG